MLQNHVRFLANINEKAAKDFTALFYESIKSLEIMPERNPYLNHSDLIKNKYRKLIMKRRYIAIYQVENRNVFIDYIVDCKEDYSWLLL